MITVKQTKFDDYQYEEIANAIKQYQQVRSSLEYIASRVDRIGKAGSRTAKEDLLCILVDIDQGIKCLTPRQKKVVVLLKQGYQYEEISAILGISTATAASHACQAFTRLTDYLNQRSKSIH